jgi:hypothetical protein
VGERRTLIVRQIGLVGDMNALRDKVRAASAETRPKVPTIDLYQSNR